jgi:hypothetical protein
MLIVGAVVEPHVVQTSSPSVAQGIFGDRPGPAATPSAQTGPFAQAGPAFGGADGATPTPLAPFPVPTEFGLRCPDPNEPAAPWRELVRSTTMPIPLYQPVPYSTGEFVAVSNTNDHGANLRVAPRALARILRVVPEGEVLETVGGDMKVDRVFWAYVRDEEGTVGWIVSHMLTGVARVPGHAPLPFQNQGAAACATFTPTPTPIVIRPGATGEPGPPGPPGQPSTGGPGGGTPGPGLIGARSRESGTEDGSLALAR